MQAKITALLLLLLVLSGCGNSSGGKAEGHEMEPLAHTAYTDKVELYVQHNPLIVGQAAGFDTHITVLGDAFKPLADAKITVSLIVNEKGIRNSTDAPASPGLFRLSLKPVQAGNGTLVFDIKANGFTDKVTIEGITIYADEAAAEKDHTHAEGEGTTIAFSKEQAWKIKFASSPAKKQDFYEVIKTNGQVLPAPGDEMVVAAKADGIVTFTGSKAIVGSEVQQGTPLFTISGENLAQGNIDTSVRESRMNYLKLKADYERAEELVKDKIISQKEFQTTKLLYENARNDYNTISKNYSGKGQAIASPMTGFIKSVMVTDGQFVQAGTPLATVSKNKRLLLQANVSQKYFGKLSGITSANFSVPDGTTYDTRALNGRVASFGKSAAVGSPFIPITFEVDNIGNIVSGSAVQVYLKSKPIPNALVIPLSSIMEEQGIYYVYVQTGGESFLKKEVQTGANDGRDVQILSGLTEGERVVTKGAYQVKLSAASGAMPAHTHEH